MTYDPSRLRLATIIADTLAVGVERTAAQRLWVPGRLPGLNEVIAAAKGSGGRGHTYAVMKRQHGELVWALAKAAKLRPMSKVHLSFRWVEKDRRRDPDNVSSAGRKFILDGLVAAGVLPGDGWAAIAGWSDTFEVGATHGVEVALIEVT